MNKARVSCSLAVIPGATSKAIFVDFQHQYANMATLECCRGTCSQIRSHPFDNNFGSKFACLPCLPRLVLLFESQYNTSDHACFHFAAQGGRCLGSSRVHEDVCSSSAQHTCALRLARFCLCCVVRQELSQSRSDRSPSFLSVCLWPRWRLLHRDEASSARSWRARVCQREHACSCSCLLAVCECGQMSFAGLARAFGACAGLARVSLDSTRSRAYFTKTTKLAEVLQCEREGLCLSARGLASVKRDVHEQLAHTPRMNEVHST